MNADGFWDNQDKAKKIVAQIKPLKAQVEPLATAMREFEDAKLGYEMSREVSDPDLLAEADATLFRINQRMERI